MYILVDVVFVRHHLVVMPEFSEMVMPMPTQFFVDFYKPRGKAARRLARGISPIVSSSFLSADGK